VQSNYHNVNLKIHRFAFEVHFADLFWEGVASSAASLNFADHWL
jgi:hypothetical protein